MLRIYSGKASPCSRIQQDTCEAQLLLQRCAVICVVCFALQQWVYIICISNEYVHVLHFICVIVCVCLKVYALMTWDGAVSHPYHLLVLAYNPSGQAQTDESSSWLPDPNFTLCCISYQVSIYSSVNFDFFFLRFSVRANVEVNCCFYLFQIKTSYRSKCTTWTY